jgi:membrane-associated phospholipid phosphatase
MAERAMLEQTRRCRAAGECVVAVFLTGLALFGLLAISLVASLVLRTPAARAARLETPRFWLTLTMSAGVLAAWAFGGLTWYVVSHKQSAQPDTHVTAWVVAHRTGWLTSIVRVVTWLGSAAVIIPLGLIVGGWFVRRRHQWRPLVLLGAAIAGAVALYDIVKFLVGRPRPPQSIWIGHFPAAAFPSGHATQTVAFYSVLAIILSAGRSPRVKLALCSAAVLVALVVGFSRIYLGAHWLTDVLGGYALGAFWAAVVMSVMLIASARVASARKPAAAGHDELPGPGAREGGS